MAVQSSRGCPFNCDFCDITKLMGRKPRLKTVTQITAELDKLYELGWRGNVFFVDDNFIGNKVGIMPILKAVLAWQEKRDYPFQFYTEASVNLARETELMRVMVAAGFNMVFLGIESPNGEALATSAKAQNVGRKMSTKQFLLESIRTIQGAGLEVSGGFIVGLDGDTEFDSHVEFIQEAGIPVAMVGLLAAIKGTDLYKRLMGEGRLLTAGEHSGNNTEFVLNFRPLIPREDVMNAYRTVISELYEPTLERYFERCLTLIEALGETEHHRSPYGLKTSVRASCKGFRRRVRPTSGFSGVFSSDVVRISHMPSDLPSTATTSNR